MCGISGIFDPRRRLDPIVPMTLVQRHRGPDDEGYVFVQTGTGACRAAGGDDTKGEPRWAHHSSVAMEAFDLALGSRRLAILDLSPAGRMPMASSDGTRWITYNGEVYNCVELREELRAAGYRFATRTDTEVILAAYDAWGADCVHRFNGMFAFALWDGIGKRLFCARDHFGIKPFYYHWDGTTLVFASEIKALLLHPAVPRKADERSVFDYLVRGVCDHEPRTFFEGIVPLPPASVLTLDAATNRLDVRQWWHASINPDIDGGGRADDERVCGRFGALLEDAVRLRLRADVPVGTCLSGGLDSSSIVCLANRMLIQDAVIPRELVGEHQKTFTARNREAELDEHRYSRLVVEQTGAEEHVVFPEGERLWQEVEAFAWHMDEPFSSTSQYPQWNVMRLASERGVTVLLDGQGGDEVLGGYYSYLPVYVKQVARRKGLAHAAGAAWDLVRVGGRPVFDTLYADASVRLPWRARRALETLGPARPTPGTGGSGVTDTQLAPAFLARYRDRLWTPPALPAEGLAGVLYRDLTSTNLPMLLRYEDRNSTAFSRETRLPFLDPRLVEYAFSLPLRYKLRGGWTKWVLRQSMEGRIPAAICWRRSKLGFPTPERRWLAEGAPFVRELFGRPASGELAEYVRPGLLAEIPALTGDALARVPGMWRLVNLALWFELFFHRGSAAAPPAPARQELAIQ